MALKSGDRVRETCTTTGTGPVSLLGAVDASYEAFSAVMSNADTCYYAIVHPATEWEVGLGTYTTSGNTLTRTTVLDGSNGASAVNLTAGTKYVFIGLPSVLAVLSSNVGTAGQLFASGGAGVLPSYISASTARTNLGLGTLATQSGTFSGTSSGTNTGDQTISLTGDVTGSGTGSFATTLAKLSAQWDTLSTTLTTGTAQPNSLADAVFSGKVAGGAVNGAGVLGVVTASFASSGAETGTSSAQGGLGSTASAGQPYNVTDFPGQRGIKVGLQKANGDTILLINVLSTAVTDANEEVYGYLSYRSDLGANLKWRLWYYYRRASDGVEVPVTPNTSLTNCILYVAEVVTLSSMSVAAPLGNPQFGEFAAEIGPGTVTLAMLAAAVLANFLQAANNGSDIANAGTFRTNLGVAIGSNVEAWSANLDTYAGKTPPVGTVLGTTDTQTLTNKRITRRVLALSANSATPAINTDNYDIVVITAQTAAITSFSSGLTGTPVEGDLLRIRITGTGAVALTWGASFAASTTALPTTTVGTAALNVMFEWQVAASAWVCLAVA